MVQFHPYEVKLRLGDRARLKKFIGQLFEGEKTALKNLKYIFCTDDYLLQINREFLHHDTYTDILTFDLSENHGEKTGEVYISVERVKENAKKFGAPFAEELHRVIFHGALHLCGYRDKSKSDSRLMRQKENEYLKKYFGQSGALYS